MRSDTDHRLSGLASSLRKRRKRLGLSQSEVGLLSGCGRVFVSQIESGKSTVRLDKLLDVLQVLGLQLSLQNGAAGIVVEEEVASD